MQGQEKVRERFSNIYRQLSSFEQAVVQAASIFGEATSAVLLFNCLRKAGISFPEGKAATVKTLETTIARLQRLKLLDSTHRCPDGFVDLAGRHAVAAGRYAAMAQAVQDLIPLGSYYYYESASRYLSRLMRDLRIGIYTENEDLVNRSLSQIFSRAPASVRDPHPILRICSNPFDPDWFDSLPVSLRLYVLEEAFSWTLSRLEPDGDYLNYAHRPEFLNGLAKSEKPRFYYTLASRLIFGGRLAEAHQVVSALEAIEFTAGLRGWLLFLEGENDRAIHAYEADLKELRRRVGKKSSYFSAEAGLFYVLALLKQSGGSMADAEPLVRAALSKMPPNGLLYPAYDCLQAVVHIENCEIEKAREILRKYELSQGGLVLLFSSFAAYWLDGRLSPERIDGLSQAFIKAREAGLNWLAMEYAELLCRAEDQTPIRRNFIENVRKETGIESIVSLVHPEEPWQRALRALVHTAASRTSAEAKPSAAIRLIWLVDMRGDALVFEPVEQKATARGNWTSGRPVALSRLYSGKNLEYLSEQDQRIKESLQRFFDRYNRVDYSFDMDKALPVLIGHPLLFLRNSPSTPVEVVKGDPELIVTQAGSELTISFSARPAESRFSVLRETPTRFKVMELTEEHQRIARLVGEEGLSVPVSAREEVIAAIAQLSSLVTVHSSVGVSGQDIETVEANPTPHVHLLPSGTGFRMELFVRPFGNDGPYLKPGVGEKNVIAEIDGNRLLTTRNLKLEAQKADAAESRCSALSEFSETDRQWTLADPEACLQVLLDLKALQEQGEVRVEWPEGEKLKVLREVSFGQLHLKIRGKADWFEMSGQLEVDDQVVLDMKRLLELLQTTTTRFIPLEDGQFVALTQEFRKRLEDLNAYAEKRGKDVRMHPLAALAVQDLMARLPHLDADSTWTSRLEAIRAGQELQPVVPSTLKAELRDYQVEGYRWLTRLASMEMGACLADDMGLGKTLQALAVLVARARRGPSLVVAPTSVCMNWMAEANRFAPTLNVVLFGGNGNSRENIVRNLKEYDVLVTSYGLLHQESELLASVEWRTIVLDEAQAIKNMTTKRSQAAMALKGEFKLITTGTPIENHLSELWTLFNFINPGLLGSYKRFTERFATPIEASGDREAKKRLKKLIQPFILRRVKSQVLEELPPRTEVVLQVEMSSEETAFYEALRQQALERLELNGGAATQKQLMVLAEIMKLRQAACNPRLVLPKSDISSSKLELFGEVVSELLENRHKALVFSQFVGHLSLIREYLDARKISYRYLDGSTPPRDRKREVDAFQAGEGDLFLISLKAGGLGLNLTAADYVIHMDPWWNPAVEDQASDRAHRIGQQHPVTVYRLVARHTIEEKIVKLHREKRDLAGSLLDGTDISGKISVDELIRLIREE